MGRYKLFIPIGAAFLLVVGLAAYIKFLLPVPEPLPLERAAKPVFTLSLDSPTQGELVLNQEILVKGKTEPRAVVLIYSDTDIISVDSDEQGNFESTILLTNGINTLTVTAYGLDGQEKSVTVDLLYDRI
ncbi:hypothetical protein HY408_02360 [Candidatus Gottesmanbacteria bacterium]|nr:hypothetical protein [Candidatus Gottesmanbacteria bacterium]